MSEIALLLRILDQAFNVKGWHGSTLAGSLRGVTVDEALWRPAPTRHNVWELALHTAYWKYVVRRRVLDEAERGGFPRSPSNWPAVPDDPTSAAWRKDVALLKRSHAALREAVAGLTASQLEKLTPKREWTYGELIHGVAAHDLYHTGQIQLLKRLHRR
jgi:hypothetical protein